jgi:hypothetical protein
MKNDSRPLDDPIRQMLALHEEGLTYRQIGQQLGDRYSVDCVYSVGCMHTGLSHERTWGL